MTTRLLSRSGHAPGGRTIRDALTTASLQPTLKVGGATLSVGTLPLFRTGAKGLEQVVRLRVEPPEATVEQLSLTDPAGNRVAAGHYGAAGIVDVLVSEVTEPMTWRVSAVIDGAEHAAEITLTPQRKFTVYLVHHSHLDIGYTDPQGIVLRNHLEYIDAAVELGREGDNTDPVTRFRWAIESNLPVRTWLENRSSAAAAEFCRLAREDVIEVTAMPFNLHTEVSSQEEFARLLRTAVELRERYGIPIAAAMHTDVPGATTGWADALYEAGVRYVSAAHNWAGRSVPYLVGGQELTRPFWWRTPAGARLLTWFTDSAHGMAYMEGNLLGLSDAYDRAVELLPMYLSALANKPFPYSEGVFGLSALPPETPITKEPYAHDLVHLRVQGDHSDNACPNATPAEIAQRWNAEWAYPRLVTSTNTGFFVEAEQQLGNVIAEFAGDWGDWWADGIGSGARPLGYNRRTQSLVRQGETIHLLADLASDTSHAVRETVDEIYDRVGLFDEHTWGAANPWHDHEHGNSSGGLQWARKSEFAHQAYDDAQDLMHGAVRRLGAAAASGAGALASVLVYNTTGRPRTDRVTAFLPESVLASNGPFVAIDARKQEQVPTRVSAQAGQPASPRGQVVEFVADDVPAMGFVRYDIAAAADPLVVTERAPNLQLSNEFYEVTYDLTQAMISSIVDRRTGRELVNSAALTGVNEYIYDTYGTAPHVNHLSSRVTASDLSLLTSRTVARNGAVLRAESSALGDLLEVEVHAPGVEWIRTTIELLAGVPRVEITNRISKLPSPTKESVYFAFPFAASDGPAAYELTGSVEGPLVPHVPGAPQHMRAIRHWVGFTDPESGYSTVWATLEAPLVQFGTIHLPYQPFPSTIAHEQPEPGTIYSWALNNIWDTNFPSQQQGQMTFRYAIAGSAEQPAHQLGAAVAAGLCDPLVPVVATGTSPGDVAPGDGTTGSLLSVDHPDVLVTSIGGPLDGSPGMAVRLRSLAPNPVEVVATLGSYAASSASVGTLLEQDLVDVPLTDGRVRTPLPTGASRTLLLRP